MAFSFRLFCFNGSKNVCTGQCGINQPQSAVTLFLSCSLPQKKKKVWEVGGLTFHYDTDWDGEGSTGSESAQTPAWRRRAAALKTLLMLSALCFLTFLVKVWLIQEKEPSAMKTYARLESQRLTGCSQCLSGNLISISIFSSQPAPRRKVIISNETFKWYLSLCYLTGGYFES